MRKQAIDDAMEHFMMVELRQIIMRQKHNWSDSIRALKESQAQCEAFDPNRAIKPRQETKGEQH